ncbi:hypothetical protein J0S82_008606, partial [Galemys pyrenaicus]
VKFLKDELNESVIGEIAKENSLQKTDIPIVEAELQEITRNSKIKGNIPETKMKNTSLHKGQELTLFKRSCPKWWSEWETHTEDVHVERQLEVSFCKTQNGGEKAEWMECDKKCIVFAEIGAAGKIWEGKKTILFIN